MIDLEAIAKEISDATSLDDLDTLEVRYLGRNGVVNQLATKIKKLPVASRRELGIEINSAKMRITKLIDDRRVSLSDVVRRFTPDFDTTLPGTPHHIPHLHPTTLVLREVVSYFRYLGYSVYEGPEIETDEYNFNKLNLPPDHPAREMQDTLYISEPEYLLRTHTSSVETRCMTQEKMPIRIIAPGKCYRNESANASNNAVFYQLEGLLIDREITMSHLKGTLEGFVKFLYGEVPTRFRCKYYPQVEPGAGMDIQCQLCAGAGCAVCKYRGWIEALGAGMVHPQALKSCGIDPAEWSGFAFGIGLDRLVMMHYGIKDIRSLYSGELAWR